MKKSVKLQIKWYGDSTISKSKILEKLQEILKLLKINNSFLLEIELVSKKRIRRLNQEYRNQTKVTDVLSFPTYIKFTDSEDMQLLGTIFVCQEVLAKQAKKQKKTKDEELEFLIIHGFLHLLGFDHKQDPDAWENIEQQLKQNNLL